MNIKDVWSRQARAARELLRWTQADLAAASKLAIGTIRNFEHPDGPLTLGTTAVLRATFEKHGIEFVMPDSEDAPEKFGVVLRTK